MNNFNIAASIKNCNGIFGNIRIIFKEFLRAMNGILVELKIIIVPIL